MESMVQGICHSLLISSSASLAAPLPGYNRRLI
jgi:hypothetical protein